MWGKTRGEDVPAAPASARGTELDLLLDAVGGLLREFAASTFAAGGLDAQSTQKLFRRWAEHAQVGAASPLEVDGEGGRPKAQRDVKSRDWAGLRASFAQQRRLEAAAVQQLKEGVHTVVSSLVTGIHGALDEVTRSDAQLKLQLSKLLEAARSSSLEELRRVTASSVQVMSQLMQERAKRQMAYVEQLATRVESLGMQLDAERKAGTTDSLTGIANRRAFDEHLQQIVESNRSVGTSAVLLLLDVDQFKRLNDTYGHPGGDAVLKSLGEALARTFRRRGDFIARLGGEEFACLARDLRGSEARALAERLLETIRTLSVPYGGQELRVTASVGFTELRAGDSVEEVVRRADQALYAAKQAGRDRAAEH